MYENAMTMGDTVLLESIELRFCGIFLVLEKYNYVEIILSQIERKYNQINYNSLQNIRINSSCRYKSPFGNKCDFSPYHVLDEVMENVNMWVKNLPLNDEQDSWVNHSPNVNAARRCLLFDRVEYKRGLVNFEKLIDERIFEQREYDRNKYVPPQKKIEKKRVFEFLTLYFGEETPNRSTSTQEMILCLNQLTTKLCRQENSANETTNKDMDLDTIFENINRIVDDDNEKVQLNMNISDDDDTNSVSSSDTQEDCSQLRNEASSTIKLNCHHKYACIDIEKLGQTSMENKNYKVIRMRKGERLARNQKFITNLYQDIIEPNSTTRSDIEWMSSLSNDDVYIPSFSVKFRNLKRYATT